MCNDCDCGAEHLCSIKGYMPFGSCCEKCDWFDEEHSCPSYQVEIAKIEVQPAESQYIEVLDSLPEKTIKLYP